MGDTRTYTKVVEGLEKRGWASKAWKDMIRCGNKKERRLPDTEMAQKKPPWRNGHEGVGQRVEKLWGRVCNQERQPFSCLPLAVFQAPS